VNVARGLVVYPKTIEAAVMAELPFMATEEILMAGVRAGGDRQELHELIRQKSLEAAEQVKTHGKANDLIDRLRGEKSLANVNLGNVLNPAAFVGRAPQQVEQFIGDVIEPIRAKYKLQMGQDVSLKV
jgi:adenylosuccinate lyase